MATKLIMLADGLMIEVEAAPNEYRQVSGGAATQVNKTVDQLKPILVSICGPVVSAWAELSTFVAIEEAEVEIGISFESEGNAYIAKLTGSANLSVKLKVRPKAQE